MVSQKVTFTLDVETLRRLQNAAERLAIPKSAVVRDAIADFHDRLGYLSDREKNALLRNFDDFVPRIVSRNTKAVDRELEEIRRARKTGGRATTTARR